MALYFCMPSVDALLNSARSLVANFPNTLDSRTDLRRASISMTSGPCILNVSGLVRIVFSVSILT